MKHLIFVDRSKDWRNGLSSCVCDTKASIHVQVRLNTQTDRHSQSCHMLTKHALTSFHKAEAFTSGFQRYNFKLYMGTEQLDKLACTTVAELSYC